MEVTCRVNAQAAAIHFCQVSSHFIMSLLQEVDLILQGINLAL